MKSLALVGLIFLSTAGFMSGNELEYRQWQRFIGMTMEAWMADTGLWPQGQFDTGPDSRTFVLQSMQCDIQLQAKFTGGEGPAAWRIVKTIHRGYCGHV